MTRAPQETVCWYLGIQPSFDSIFVSNPSSKSPGKNCYTFATLRDLKSDHLIHPSCQVWACIVPECNATVNRCFFFSKITKFDRKLLFFASLGPFLAQGPSSVRCPFSVHHFQRSSSPKLLGQSKSNFIWSLSGMGERKFVRGVWVTWPRWPPRPYLVKTLQKSSSPEPKGQWLCGLVCSIGALGPS